ncbi:MAG TPA: glycerol-3-phosphate dehydrogenase/oxidase [Candidatus Eisenbacteria bacterium]|nr:glycerol-3-phosphate dehydrogenase/oxidase [Candidatus Eisenbacteria bacterium]
MTMFDAVVVGGGITGLGIARLAARNGLSVALVERGDLGSGASSASSHMLHGGLRYLEHGDFVLVSEALRERAAVSRMAPSLARPTRFMIPFYRGDRRPPWMVRIGLFAYDAFAGRSTLARHASVRRAEALALEPDLAEGGLKGAGLYTDAVMDDARLAVAVGLDAVSHGAQVHNYTEAIGLRPADADRFDLLARDRLSGAEIALRGRVIINATGPWADRTRAMLLGSLKPGSIEPAPVLRPSRGVHLVFPRLTRSHGVLLFARSDGRVFFVIPFGEHSLVGTTEVEVVSPLRDDDVSPSVEEIRYLRSELARAIPKAAEAPAMAVLSGVRPLLAATGPIAAATREHRLIDDGPLLTVVGGKYTTFRVMARDAVKALVDKLKRGGPDPRDSVEPLPRLPEPTESLEAFAESSAQSAFARRVEDVIRRRSRLWLTPDRGRVAAPQVAAGLARALGWSPERARAEQREFFASLEHEDRLLVSAREVA